MNQAPLIILCSLFMGAFGIFVTWVSIDAGDRLAIVWKARKERKRLAAAAKAEEEAKASAEDGGDEKGAKK